MQANQKRIKIDRSSALSIDKWSPPKRFLIVSLHKANLPDMEDGSEATLLEQMIGAAKSAATRVLSLHGQGHTEAVYRNSLSLELQEDGYLCSIEVPIIVYHRLAKTPHIQR